MIANNKVQNYSRRASSTPDTRNCRGSNLDVQNVQLYWRKDYSSANWSMGYYFLQYYKNSSFHRIIGRSPYCALIGTDPDTILRGTNIPDSVISSIQAQMENVETDSFSLNTFFHLPLSTLKPNHGRIFVFLIILRSRALF